MGGKRATDRNEQKTTRTEKNEKNEKRGEYKFPQTIVYCGDSCVQIHLPGLRQITKIAHHCFKILIFQLLHVVPFGH